jgi:hypothetical protein
MVSALGRPLPVAACPAVVVPARAGIGQEQSVAASEKLPNSSRWKLAQLVLVATCGSPIPASVVSGYTAYD